MIVILTKCEREKDKKIRVVAYDDVQAILGLFPHVVSRERRTKMVKGRISGLGYNKIGVGAACNMLRNRNCGMYFCSRYYPPPLPRWCSD